MTMPGGGDQRTDHAEQPRPLDPVDDREQHGEQRHDREDRHRRARAGVTRWPGRGRSRRGANPKRPNSTVPSSWLPRGAGTTLDDQGDAPTAGRRQARTGDPADQNGGSSPRTALTAAAFDAGEENERRRTRAGPDGTSGRTFLDHRTPGASRRDAPTEDQVDCVVVVAATVLATRAPAASRSAMRSAR